MGKHKEKKLKEGWVMPGGEKIALVVGAGCNNAFNVLMMSFLTGYLLIVGINPVVSAAILLVLKVWDAINDVIFGYLVDKIRFKPGKNWFTKWLFSGRYMPWFRFLLGLMPLGAILVYTIGNVGDTQKIVQFTIGYLLYDLGMTASGAYDLLPISVTANYNERNFVVAYSGLGQGFGSLPILLIGTGMIASGVPYSTVIPIFAVYAFLLGVIPAIFVKERNPSAVNSEANPNYSVKQMFKAVKMAPDFLFLVLAMLISGIFNTGQFGLMLGFYIYGDPNLATIVTAISIVPSIVLIPFLPGLFKRIDKMVIARVCYGVNICSSLVMVALGKEYFYQNPEHISLSIILTAIGITGSTIANFGVGMIGPDIIEKARYRSGEDIAGIFGAIKSFVSKLVNAMTSSIALFILSLYGWNSNFSAGSYEELQSLVDAGMAVQSEHALQGLWDVSYLFPMIGCILAFALYFFIRVGRREAQIYMAANAGEISHEDADKLLSDKSIPLPEKKIKECN